MQRLLDTLSAPVNYNWGVNCSAKAETGDVGSATPDLGAAGGRHGQDPSRTDPYEPKRRSKAENPALSWRVSGSLTTLRDHSYRINALNTRVRP